MHAFPESATIRSPAGLTQIEVGRSRREVPGAPSLAPALPSRPATSCHTPALAQRSGAGFRRAYVDELG